MRTLLKSMVYGTVELATAGRGVRRTINGTPIRFPARWARFYPRDYEQAKFAFLREHCAQGSVAFDIGAHIGLFSVLMARSVGASGRVFAFEPTPRTREILRKTVRLNACDGIVDVRPEALSSASGQATFHETADLASNANSLVPGPRSCHTVAVETVTVDEFAVSRSLNVGCLKIDVEGAEWDVLKGAERTIQSCRPALVLELHPEALASSGRSVAAVVELLQAYDFAAFIDGAPVDYNWLREQTELIEIQALPRDRISAEASSKDN